MGKLWKDSTDVYVGSGNVYIYVRVQVCRGGQCMGNNRKVLRYGEKEEAGAV